ncbi:MAG: MBL fold metallo-hydrolase [Bacilli bacterium]|nr:MBL fold metallo-hydrolase [Bacilli bacterium]
MEIKCVVTGYLDENCYILIHDGKCLVVDPGDDFIKIKDTIGDNQVLGVLITHSHADHIGALRNFLTKRSIKIFKRSNLEDGMHYDLGDFHFQAFHTPGHSKDSVSFFFEEEGFMLVGDFIFKDSVGRCDLPGGSESELKESLLRMKEFSPEIILYPGHYESTTLGEEMKNNPYLQ